MSPYPYHVFYPEAYGSDQERQWPLILFLHGAGEKGKNLEKVKKTGLPKLLEQRPDFPFVVAWPQCPKGQYWNVQHLSNWLADVLETTRQIDQSRIYLTGLSMGGYGTWHWATASPQKFAAILPICGGGDPERAFRLKHLPTWAFHGAQDRIVPLGETVEMVEAVKAAGGQAKLTIYPQLGHDSWTETYQNPEVYDWLLSYHL